MREIEWHGERPKLLAPRIVSFFGHLCRKVGQPPFVWPHVLQGPSGETYIASFKFQTLAKGKLSLVH